MRKYLFIVLLFAACSKDASKPAQPTTPIALFSNSNVSFDDYSYGIVYAGSNASVYVDVILSNVSGLTKVELVKITTQAVMFYGVPTNGTNRMYDHLRDDVLNQVAYKLRFTRSDNTTFETGNFNVRK